MKILNWRREDWFQKSKVRETGGKIVVFDSMERILVKTVKPFWLELLKTLRNRVFKKLAGFNCSFVCLFVCLFVSNEAKFRLIFAICRSIKDFLLLNLQAWLCCFSESNSFLHFQKKKLISDKAGVQSSTELSGHRFYY